MSLARTRLTIVLLVALFLMMILAACSPAANPETDGGASPRVTQVVDADTSDEAGEPEILDDANEDEGQDDSVFTEDDTETLEPEDSGDSEDSDNTDNAGFSDYEIFLDETSGELSAALQQFHDLNRTLVANPELLNDESWHEEMTNTVARIDAVVNEVLEYPAEQVPSDYVELHLLYLQAASQYQNGTTVFLQGLQARDVDVLNSGMELIVEGDELIKELIESVRGQ